MKRASSLARYRHMLAISSTSVSRPSGTFPINFARFSGVSSIPVNVEKSPVPERRGATVLNRILWGPYSAARPLVAYIGRLLAIYYSFAVQEFTHISDCPLGGIIPNQPRPWSTRSRGGDVDHRSTLALLDETRRQGLCSEINALHVDLEHAFPLFFCNLCCRLK